VADIFAEVTAVGIQGLSGTAAGAGATGATGTAGATGPQGPAGASGVGGGSGDGATGSTGPAGSSGAAGATGTQGASGISGASGYVGSDGATGPSGAAGSTGAQGASGSTGLTGATGVRGASGVDGTSFTIVGTVAESSLLPIPYTGSVGDGYITEDLGDLWVWDGSAWLDAGPIVGPAGATGTAGATGVRGATGITGASGSTGLTGATGSQGINGATGVIGASGVGATGVTGASGISGASGYVGSDGATGPQGIQGASGVTGASGISGASGYVGSDGASGVSGATGQTGATGAGLEVTTYTTSSTNEVIIDDWDTTADRSVKYEMQITSGSDYSASELRLLHDDANVYISEYAVLGNSLGTFSTHFSPVSNNYSSPDINAGSSHWTNNDLVIYTTDSETILALLSILPSTTVAFNSGAASTTLSTKFVETSSGIFEATTSTSRSPLLLVTNISWTGTGNCELRFTPTNSVTTLKYIRTGIPV